MSAVETSLPAWPQRCPSHWDTGMAEKGIPEGDLEGSLGRAHCPGESLASRPREGLCTLASFQAPSLGRPSLLQPVPHTSVVLCSWANFSSWAVSSLSRSLCLCSSTCHFECWGEASQGETQLLKAPGPLSPSTHSLWARDWRVAGSALGPGCQMTASSRQSLHLPRSWAPAEGPPKRPARLLPAPAPAAASAGSSSPRGIVGAGSTLPVAPAAALPGPADALPPGGRDCCWL